LSPLSYEIGLFGLAVLFYLYDSTVLLYSNEAVFACDSRLRWSAATGWAGFLLSGRTLCLLSPFTPHRPSFRLRWDYHSLLQAPPSIWMDRAQELKVLAPTTLTAAIALYVLLPLGMFTALGAYAVIPALVLLYGSIFASLFLVRRRRILIPPGPTRFLSLAFECIACPPFGVNMVRRTTLAYRIAEPLPLAGARLLDRQGWGTLRCQCVLRIDDALQSAAAESDEERSLMAQRQRLLDLDEGK
jgi:hypothetical protein